MAEERSGHTPASIPGSLGIAVPPGGRVTAVHESAAFVAVSLVYPLGDLDRLVSFYDEALAGWVRSPSIGGGPPGREYVGDRATVVVTTCVDTEAAGYELDAACVSITRSKR